METESVLQSLMVHTSFLELQVTQQVLQFQSGTDWSWAPQDHHAKLTLNLNNSARSSTVSCETDISAEVFSFKCISQQVQDEPHPKWFFFL